MLLFWIIGGLAVVMLGRWLGSDSDNRNDNHTKTAIEILEERYAHGEINREEFEQKKHDLQHQ